MNNCQRRDAGLAYISDAEVFEEQKIAQRILHKFNHYDPTDYDGLKSMVKELLGSSENAFINPPFHCDYGKHIHAGKNLFINYNCTILDVATVSIGDNCLIAPNVGIYTAGHPLHPFLRNKGVEYGAPICIGNNVWIGGNCVILPGVSIGDNCTIGAGSVVTKDIPANSIAAGNPCKVIRELTDNDKMKFCKDRIIDSQMLELIN
ncbi:MAG: sugar O-acetyltransferase [Succinivibrio sp.]